MKETSLLERTDDGGKLLFTEREFASLDSVEIKKGAKGDVTFSVKCYGNTIEEAEEKATKIFDDLNRKYVE